MIRRKRTVAVFTIDEVWRAIKDHYPERVASVDATLPITTYVDARGFVEIKQKVDR